MTTLVITFVNSYSEDRRNDRVYFVSHKTSILEILEIVQQNTNDLVVMQRIAQRIVARRNDGASQLSICCGPFRT